MMASYRFTIPGQPVAKGRPRFRMAANGPRTYPEAKTVAYEGLVAIAAQNAGVGLLRGPVAIRLRAYFAWPRSKWRTRNPLPAAPKPDGRDLDNVLKAVADGLNGVAYTDDRQIWRIDAEKWYAAQGEPERCEVEIEEVSHA